MIGVGPMKIVPEFQMYLARYCNFYIDFKVGYFLVS
jgi:hypothetical protein